MNRNYTKIYARILLLAAGMCLSFTMAGTAKIQKGDSTYLHLLNKNKKEKTLLRANLPAIKFYSIPVSKPYVASADDKLLSNVQVYPNPIVNDQINVKYSISRDANVSIKIMDVLGNEVMPLFSQRVDHGDKKFSAILTRKLNSGFYFLRIVVGTESFITRISIL